MPENFLEINGSFALTSYYNTIGQSNNAFSILGFSLAGKRRVHVLIFSSIGLRNSDEHLPKPFFKVIRKSLYCSANHESLFIPYLPRLNSFEHTGLVLYLQAYKLQRGECFIREKTTILPVSSSEFLGIQCIGSKSQYHYCKEENSSTEMSFLLWIIHKYCWESACKFVTHS